jgi:hypothetical protein
MINKRYCLAFGILRFILIFSRATPNPRQSCPFAQFYGAKYIHIPFVTAYSNQEDCIIAIEAKVSNQLSTAIQIAYIQYALEILYITTIFLTYFRLYF